VSGNDDHGDRLTGTGTSRSERPPATTGAGSPGTSDAAITGATTSAHPSETGTGGANRSGSGGSGGSGDPAEEGSSGQSLDELLTGDESSSRPDR
jgi:hypothetical protein